MRVVIKIIFLGEHKVLHQTGGFLSVAIVRAILHLEQLEEVVGLHLYPVMSVYSGQFHVRFICFVVKSHSLLG
jgi:hypothetical protein